MHRSNSRGLLRAAAAITALLSALALNLLTAGPSQARAESEWGVMLTNYSTGKCLDTHDTGIPNLGTIVEQFNCNPTLNQKWDLVDGQLGFVIKNSRNPSLCLDLPDTGATGPSRVGFYYCNDTVVDNQLWYKVWSGDWFQIVNLKSAQAGRRMCLDVAGWADPSNGALIGVYDCHDSTADDHWWRVL
ncbi:RICIN domain-containing protein [Streptomyces sp. NPDC059447]|uniref:RICIN domain-containing protein n=1 Tax=Streptomyces sp. NPDC059447 TaxID=3346834 RepID=UPI00369CAA72